MDGEPAKEGVGPASGDNYEASKMTYEERAVYACKVCQNVPDEYGTLDHGKGCYTQSEDGGGTSYVELPR